MNTENKTKMPFLLLYCEEVSLNSSEMMETGTTVRDVTQKDD